MKDSILARVICYSKSLVLHSTWLCGLLPPGTSSATSAWECGGVYSCNCYAVSYSVLVSPMWLWRSYSAMPSLLQDIKADFGAVGDGKTDDTQAFMDALSAVRDRAVLFIPSGERVPP